MSLCFPNTVENYLQTVLLYYFLNRFVNSHSKFYIEQFGRWLRTIEVYIKLCLADPPSQSFPPVHNTNGIPQTTALVLSFLQRSYQALCFVLNLPGSLLLSHNFWLAFLIRTDESSELLLIEKWRPHICAAFCAHLRFIFYPFAHN